MIRISLNVKSQGTKIIDAFSQGTDESKNLRCETLYVAHHKYVNISSFVVLDIKLWLEEDGKLKTGHTLYSLKFIQRLKIDTKCCHLLAITLYPT